MKKSKKKKKKTPNLQFFKLNYRLIDGYDDIVYDFKI